MTTSFVPNFKRLSSLPSSSLELRPQRHSILHKMPPPTDLDSDMSQEKGLPPQHIEEQFRIQDRGQKLSKKEKIEQVNAIINREDVTLDTFAHLDIKKILRKMDLHTVPILTILYLLSFLDRGNVGRRNSQCQERSQ